MKTIDESQVRADLIERLERLTPAAQGQWGELSCQQMLVHVAARVELTQAPTRVHGPASAVRERKPAVA